jgi:uncharacterized membrane protein YkvA (DUF1232 family)
VTLKALIRELRIGAHAVWIGARDPAVPAPVRLFGLAVAAYAFSPVDLIPDFVPILGLLDDAILVPLGVWLFMRMIPRALHARHRAEAEAAAARPVSRWGAAAVVALWAALVGWIGVLIWSGRFW